MEVTMERQQRLLVPWKKKVSIVNQNDNQYSNTTTTAATTPMTMKEPKQCSRIFIVLLVFVVQCCLSPHYLFANGFVLKRSSSISSNVRHSTTIYHNTPSILRGETRQSSLSSLQQSKNDVTEESPSESSLEIVLFGIGDLRTEDHGGLYQAIENLNASTSSQIATLFLLDKELMQNIPGARTHSLDTSLMVKSALEDLSYNLQTKFDLTLQICDTSNASIETCLNDIISASSTTTTTNVHVCDLGLADTSMKYNPFSKLMDDLSEDYKFNVMEWNCCLRDTPYQDCSSRNNSFPLSFPDYQTKYLNKGQVNQPINVTPIKVSKEEQFLIPSKMSCDLPNEETLLKLMTGSDEQIKNKQALEEGAMTGLFGTHWGGYNPMTCTETDTLRLLNTYVSKECQMSDEFLIKEKEYTSNIKNNPRSLEHCSICEWQSLNLQTSKNLIDGELVVRALSAPLLMGCLSNRQLKQFAQRGEESMSKNWFDLTKRNPLDDLVESREWHTLFATKCLLPPDDKEIISYKYWRWQGFLCRYGIKHLTDNNDEEKLSSSSSSSSDSAIVLVHGFGASGTQWEGMIDEISNQNQQPSLTNAAAPTVAYAPDLIGFGQCEKPFLTYTQYLWESQTSDFIKDVVLNKHDGYFVGGNSIGGYTAMGVAADDSIVLKEESSNQLTVTANGAPGTGTCQGLILMNSAGPILSEEDIQQRLPPFVSVAERTARMGLAPCSPPPKLVATLFGNGLLWYLRPRIQSICVNLYPTNPNGVSKALCENILRDSLDPGALAVMLSGSKLPTPRTANELLGANFGSPDGAANVKEGQFQGPVLIAQGLKDPLNDAVKRANMFTQLRNNIILEEIDGGHCPHDELPKESANAFWNWWQRINANDTAAATSNTMTTTVETVAST